MLMCRELSEAEIDSLEDKYLSIYDEYGEDKYIEGVYEFVKALFEAAQVQQTQDREKQDGVL